MVFIDAKLPLHMARAVPSMISKRVAILATLGGLSLPLAGCWLNRAFRYRLTMSVHTPSGLVSGSTVIEVTFSDTRSVPFFSTEARGFRANTSGEAIYLDLGDGKNVVSTFNMDISGQVDVDFSSIIFRTLDINWTSKEQIYENLEAAAESGTVFSVPQRWLPVLVTFRDPTDYQSFEILNPEQLSQKLGPGVSFAGMTVSILSPTSIFRRLALLNEPLYSGRIAKALPWLEALNGHLSGNFTCNPTHETCLRRSSFLRKPR
jgi:hypothetical protein